MKPLIGIIEWPYLDKDNDHIYEVMTDLVNWINYMGGYPIGIFPTQKIDYVSRRLSEIPAMTGDEAMDLIRLINKCDAIIKPGATRIYEHEKFIYGYTVRTNIPYLGICAGMQIMVNYNSNVKNIPTPNEEESIEYINHANTVHDVTIYPNTLLRTIIGKEHILVHSKHRYQIATPGINTVNATSLDGVIEAIESPYTSFNLGVQWHPELEPFNNQDSQNLFGSLIEHAKIYAKRK